MAQFGEFEVPAGLLNRDTKPEGVVPYPKGESPYILNLQTSLDSRNAMVNYEGTRAIANQSPAGVNKTIGQYFATDLNAVIFFNYNSNGNHGIYIFRQDTQDIEELVIWSGFNWGADEVITGIGLMDKKHLIWADSQDIRHVNIERATSRKKRKYRLTLTGKPTQQTRYDVVVYDEQGQFAGGISTLLFNVQDKEDKEQVLKGLTDEINASIAILQATICSGYIEVELQQEGKYTVEFSSSDTGTISVPENFYPEPYKEEYFTLIKKPYPCHIRISGHRDEDVDLNNIYGKSFQFRIQIVYKDYFYSVLSPISELARIYEVYPLDRVTGNTVHNNAIYNYYLLDYSEGMFNNVYDLAIIDAIIIYVREGNDGEWNYWKRVNWWEFWEESGTSGVNHIRFYNDGIYEAIDQEVANRPYDFIPLTAKALTIADESVIVGNIKEGYDIPCSEINLELEKVSMPFMAYSQGLTFDNFLNQISNINNYLLVSGIGYQKVPIVFNDEFDFDNVYDLQNAIFTPVREDHYVLKVVLHLVITNALVNNGLYDVNLVIDKNINGVVSQDIIAIGSNDVQPVLGFKELYYENIFEYDMDVGDSISFSLELVPQNPNTQHGVSIYYLENSGISQITRYMLNYGWKWGGVYEVGIIYYDKYMRTPGVSKGLRRIRIPYPMDEQSLDRYDIKWAVNDDSIPEWAQYYKIVVSENLKQLDYIQWNVYKVETVTGYTISGGDPNLPRDEVVTAGWQQGGLKYKLYLTGITKFNARYKNSKKAYVFTDGDVVVPIKKKDGTLWQGDAPYWTIEGFENDALIIDASNDVFEIEPGDVIEIFTPRREVENKLYYEYPECYRIANAGTELRTHEIKEGVLRRSDCYYRWRGIVEIDPASEVNDLYIEDMSPTDFFDIPYYWQGRGFAEGQIGQVTLPAGIRFSNRYIRDTKINGLNTFEGLNFENLNAENGGIQSLVISSDDPKREVLLAIQEKRVVSIYVGELIYSDIAGQDTIAVSSRKLGTQRTLQGNFGTKHPESVAGGDGQIFFWDSERGVVVRYTVSGLYPISNYFMKSYFRNQIGNRAIGGYDRYNYRYYLTFPDANSLEGTTGETVVYSISKERWESFVSFIPDLYSNIAESIVTFKDGIMYIHDSQTRNNFYGTQYPSKYTVVINEPTKNIRILQRARLVSNKKWTAEPIIIHPHEGLPSGMLSRIRQDNWYLYEGDFWAEFLRDMNDPHFATQVEALLRGRPLRGRSAEMVLVNSDSDEVYLYGIEIFANLSAVIT